MTDYGRCAICGGVIRWVESPTGKRWEHEVRPDDDHDAETAKSGMVLDQEAQLEAAKAKEAQP